MPVSTAWGCQPSACRRSTTAASRTTSPWRSHAHERCQSPHVIRVRLGRGGRQQRTRATDVGTGERRDENAVHAMPFAAVFAFRPFSSNRSTASHRARRGTAPSMVCSRRSIACCAQSRRRTSPTRIASDSPCWMPCETVRPVDREDARHQCHGRASCQPNILGDAQDVDRVDLALRLRRWPRVTRCAVMDMKCHDSRASHTQPTTTANQIPITPRLSPGIRNPPKKPSSTARPANNDKRASEVAFRRDNGRTAHNALRASEHKPQAARHEMQHPGGG